MTRYYIEGWVKPRPNSKRLVKTRVSRSTTTEAITAAEEMSLDPTKIATVHTIVSNHGRVLIGSAQAGKFTPNPSALGDETMTTKTEKKPAAKPAATTFTANVWSIDKGKVIRKKTLKTAKAIIAHAEAEAAKTNVREVTVLDAGGKTVLTAKAQRKDGKAVKVSVKGSLLKTNTIANPIPESRSKPAAAKPAAEKKPVAAAKPKGKLKPPMFTVQQIADMSDNAILKANTVRKALHEPLQLPGKAGEWQAIDKPANVQDKFLRRYAQFLAGESVYYWTAKRIGLDNATGEKLKKKVRAELPKPSKKPAAK